jgi:hypothetical protein
MTPGNDGSDGGEGGDGATLLVEWAVSDPDDDLATIGIVVLETVSDGAGVVDRRTVEVDGFEATDATAFDIDGADTAYGIRLEAVDDAGNTAVAVTRDAPDE